MRKTMYKVPVVWTMMGYLEVAASSPEDAVKLAKDEGVNCPLPDNGQYLEDSFEIDEEGEPLEVGPVDYPGREEYRELYDLISSFLQEIPPEEECSDSENEVAADLANLKATLGNHLENLASAD